MGSVIDYIECPNCKHEAHCEYYYKTGEGYTNCNNCGYRKTAVIINRNKLMSELTEADWQCSELLHPYGAFRLKYYENVGCICGSIIDENHFNEIINEYINDTPNIELFSTSRFIDGKIIESFIIVNGKLNN